jgi:DNA ligase (NAD+)
MKIVDMLEFVDKYGFEGFDDEKIEELEGVIIDLNKSMNDPEAVLVADGIYDALFDLLKRLKPDADVLNTIWEEDGDITDYTDLLVRNPMMSIETAKSFDCPEILQFVDRLPDTADYMASFKLNGHGIRIVYEDGLLVSATSRARSSAGRDLTEHMKHILGVYNESLEDYGLVEIRAEAVLRTSLMSEAREFNSSLKSPFSAVASLMRQSATEEEVKLLSVICYKVLSDNLDFETLSEEYSFLEDCGFEVPEHGVISNLGRESIIGFLEETLIPDLENLYEEYDYFCDGIVFGLNDSEEFNSLGSEGKSNNGNIALKVGVWKQDVYTGIVNKIIWTRGKNKLSPVAIVSENYGDLEEIDGKYENLNDIGILTIQGNKVKRVPLYEPKNILILECYEGEPLSFRYGGEAGVVPCFSDGRLLKEDVAREILT